eukprot:COSAG06_NODE_6041_length_3139_cov_4.860197_1_plen_149_part_00
MATQKIYIYICVSRTAPSSSPCASSQCARAPPPPAPSPSAPASPPQSRRHPSPYRYHHDKVVALFCVSFPPRDLCPEPVLTSVRSLTSASENGAKRKQKRLLCCFRFSLETTHLSCSRSCSLKQTFSTGTQSSRSENSAPIMSSSATA